MPLISGAMVALRTARTVPTTSVRIGRRVRSACATWTTLVGAPGVCRFAGSPAQPESNASNAPALMNRSARRGERVRRAAWRSAARVWLCGSVFTDDSSGGSASGGEPPMTRTKSSGHAGRLDPPESSAFAGMNHRARSRLLATRENSCRSAAALNRLRGRRLEAGGNLPSEPFRGPLDQRRSIIGPKLDRPDAIGCIGLVADELALGG